MPMPKTLELAKVDLDVEPGARTLANPNPETPFRILILGDFSGRASRGVMEPASALASRRPVEVDRDNLDRVAERFGIALSLPVGGPGGPRLALQFQELDDFHPDRLYDRLEVFAALRRAREKLEDPSSFPDTAAELESWSGRPPAAPAPDIQQMASGNLLDQMIEATEGRPAGAEARRAPDPLVAYLRAIVGPHLEPKPHPKQKELVAQLEGAIAGGMRAILHHPVYQAAEAAWRGLHWLVRGLDTGVHLKVFVFDVSRAEIEADLNSATDLKATAVYKLLVEQTVNTPGADPWAVVAGLYTFRPHLEDVELLSRLALVAARARAPFLAAAHPLVLGCESLAETPDPDDWKKEEDNTTSVWEFIRQTPEAPWLGLALPRFLLRLPYGKGGQETERFDFEEMPGRPRHDDYLWANPALACLLLLGQAFSEFGWGLRPGVFQEIGPLPAHVYKVDGEARMTPCAEACLTERAAQRILDKGLMPLLSIKDRPVARLARFQSLARPEAPLAGRWSG